MKPPGRHLPSWLHRLTAVLGVVWMLALGGLGVRPDWHEAVCRHRAHDVAHAHDGVPGGDEAAGCVVTHFARGQLLATAAAPVLVVAAVWRLLSVLAEPERVAVSLDRALPPGCGPPRG